MHDPSHVAFEIKRPWPTTPFRKSDGASIKAWRYYPALITIWHTNPKGHDSGAQGGCCPRWPKFTEAQEKIVLELAKWEHEHPYIISRRNVGPGDAAAMAVWVFTQLHWRLHKKQLPLKLWRAAYEFGINEVDGCRESLSQPRYRPQENTNAVEVMHELVWETFRNSCHPFSDEAKERYGDKGEVNPVPLSAVEAVLRMFMRVYLRELRPWYTRICWVPTHYHIQWHFGQTLKRWLFQRCSKCGKGFKWGQSGVTYSWDPPHIPWWQFWRCRGDLMHEKCHGIAICGSPDGHVEPVNSRRPPSTYDPGTIADVAADKLDREVDAAIGRGGNGSVPPDLGNVGGGGNGSKS